MKKSDDGRRTSSWFYRNSLTLAFVGLFLGTFAAHMVFGAMAYNEAQAMTVQPAISVAAYLHTGDFWFKTFQTWEAEFGVIGLFLVLTIFLRQQGSAESKPVGSSDEETGETNE